jgi:hypothetical protein
MLGRRTLSILILLTLYIPTLLLDKSAKGELALPLLLLNPLLSFLPLRLCSSRLGNGLGVLILGISLYMANFKPR